LEKDPTMTIVAEASDGHEAVALCRKLKPSVVVMDITMPGLNGIDATRQIAAEMPQVKVVGLSMNSDRRYVLAMLAAGASGYLLKNAASDELQRAIHTVVANQKYVSPLVADAVIDAAIREALPPATPADDVLSGREREVLQSLAEGRTSKEIAAKLGVAVSTVETHRRQIMDKLSLRSIAELTKYAIRAGLTSLDP
ncbi:MAG TPA: response regulator transcription factor, partial [Polyangiaceae bacterium]|nr:response regulator transcription factor [Polyangiaceae bacterium]